MSLVPYVVEQTARGERSYDIFSRLLNDRIIVLSEDVNPNSASVIIAQLLYLEGQDPEKDISFYIKMCIRDRQKEQKPAGMAGFHYSGGCCAFSCVHLCRTGHPCGRAFHGPHPA